MVRIFCLILLFQFLNLYAVESKWKSGNIVFKNNIYIKGEYYINSDGSYFVRKTNVGRQFSSEEISSVVDDDYLNKIKSSSPANSSLESIFYLKSGAEYTLKQKREIEQSNFIAFGSKLTSLAFVGYFFYDTIKKQKEVSNSIYFLDYNQKKNDFFASRERFQISTAIFAVLTLYYAVEAFYNFDTDRDGNSTGAYKASEISLEDYVKQTFPQGSYLNQKGNTYNFEYSLSYEKNLLYF